MRILIVDDEPDIVELLAGVCEQEGHEVVTSTRSMDALPLLEQQAVDLLVTDISMPAPDGLELVRRGREHDPRLMAVVITGYGARYPVDQVLAAGASDLMLKPFRMEEFKARVALAAQRREHLDALHQRQRGLQEVSTEMIRGLQNELEAARRMAADARHATPRVVGPSH
ncbi:MAG: response regulator [Vicinamibacterales bacterium]